MKNIYLIIIIVFGVIIGFICNMSSYNKGWNDCMDVVMEAIDTQQKADTTTTTFIQFDDTLYYQFSHKKLFE